MSHPITPPLELVHQWMRQWNADHLNQGDQLLFVAAKAAQWGYYQCDAIYERAAMEIVPPPWLEGDD